MQLRWVAIAGLVASACHHGSDAPPDELHDLTEQLVALDKAWWASAQDATLGAEIVDVATRRAPLWVSAVQGDPARALRDTVPSDIAIALPADAAGLVEQPFERNDQVASWVADNTNGTATYGLAFDAGLPTSLSLYLAPGISRPRQDETFHVTGFRLGTTVLVGHGDRDPQALTGIEWTNEKVLAVLVNFSDHTLTSTLSDVTTQIATTASYYNTLSAGVETLTGTAFGPFTSTDAQPCTLSGLEYDGLAVLAAQGIDTSGYNQIVFVTPDANCGFSGISEIGQATNGRATISIVNGLGAMTHELGHAHGLYHAHKYTCPGSDLAADESTCAYTEYGHPTDKMASAPGAFDAFGQIMLGYIGRTGYGVSNLVTASGSYTLSSLTGAAANTRLLQVPYEKDPSTGWGRSFYVEYHTATGLDAYLAGGSYENKVFVTLGTDADGNSGYYLKALGVGDTFTAPNGTTITATAEDSSGATIAVVMPAAQSGCVRATPSLLISSEWIETPDAAGSTTQFQVEVYNKDSAECGPSKFSLSSADLPSGWSLVGSDIVAYGGGFGNGLFYVTSPASATGTTTFTVTANDAAVTNHSASMATTFVVSTCNPVAPTLTLTPTTGMKLAAGSSANYLLSLTNNNDSSCGSISVPAIVGLGPDNWTVNAESLTMSAAAGATVTQELTATAPATATGTNEIGVYIRYLVNGHSYYSKLVHADATIGTTCVHTPPQVTISPTLQSSLSTTELDYTVTVRNLDGPNCTATAPNTIALAVTPPSGLTATLDAASVSLAQNASTTTTLRLTPTSSTPGDYTATVTATNAGSATSAKATYRLTCGTITAPKVSISPSTQQGQPGDALTYGVTITNPNTSTLCGSRTYSLASTVTNLNGTTGWMTSLDAPSVTLASGASTTTTLTVTSPANAAAPWAVYEPVVTATDDLGNGKSASAFYAILCDTNPPTITLSPAASTTTPGNDVPITVTITDNDTINCPWTMDFTQTLPSGWTDSTLPAEITLSGGQIATYTWTPHVPATAAGGVYSPKLVLDNAGIASSATETVTVTCPGHVAPTVTISPSSQSGAPGSGLDYTATIKNNDPAGCSAQTFAVTDSLPSGWGADLDQTSVTLSQGQSTDVDFYVTSTSSAYGTNSVSVTATGAASGAGTGSASDVVTCTTAKPKVSLSPSTQSGAPGATLAYTATITNQDKGCAPETIALATSLPSGWTGSVSAPSVVLASGAATTATLSATSAATATGTNTVGVAATATAGATTGTASYVVTCTRNAPSVALTPTSQAGAPGASLIYSATITNNDVGCSSGTFAVATSLPSGWTGSVSTASVSLAAGAATTVSLTATSSASAIGSNTVGVKASNAASGATTGTATYAVTCTNNAPMVSLSPTTQSGAAGATLTYTATITNEDAGCAASTFAVAPTLPSGWTGSVSPTSVTLASGSSTTATLSATSAATATGSNTVGVSASDAASGTGSATATYTIAAACTHATPTLAISPTTQSGTAGAALAYTVTVTNNDSAGCASEAFSLARTLPAMPMGWAGTFSPTSLTLAAGASNTSTLTVTSPAMLMANTYSVSVTTTNASSGSASGSASYVVAAACTRTTPLVAISPTTQSAISGALLSYTATITNRDSACGSSTLTVSASGPSGWTAQVSQTSVTLGSGASTTVTLSATSPATAAAATYSVAVTAQDAASGQGTGTASYVVTSTCTRAAPSVSLAPSSQSGLAGASLTYMATVTNHDTTCGSSTFAVATTAPNAAWTVTPATPTVTLASGAATTVAVTATSDPSATPATYSVGASATDVASGTGAGAASYVVAPACSHAAPTVAISPATQSASVGTAAAYTLTVTNNDTACAAGSFALTSQLPSGWTGVFSSTPLAIAAGASGTATWTVTSAVGASLGDTTIHATATDASSGAAAATAVDTVIPLCVRAAPTVALSPSSQSGVAGTTLVYLATITNNDSGCADETFTLTDAEPSGFSGSLASSTISLSAGASTQIEYDATSQLTAPDGNATMRVTAAGTASGSSFGTAVYAVTDGCVAGTPTLALAPATQTANAGAPVVYTATLTSTDVGCAAATFALSPSAPSGWTATTSVPTTLLASGAQTTFSVTVTSSADAVGDNVITVNATAGVVEASATATYSVACNHAPPVVAISPANGKGDAGEAVAYQVTVTNASTGCANEVFAFTADVPDAWTSSFTASSATLERGAAVTTTLSVTSAADADAGAYPVTVHATGAQAASADAMYTVNAATAPTAPSKSGGCAATTPTGAWPLGFALALAVARRRRRTR